MRKRWGIWVLFLLGFLCCCLPLLAHLYSQKEQEQEKAASAKESEEQEEEPLSMDLSGLNEEALSMMGISKKEVADALRTWTQEHGFSSATGAQFLEPMLVRFSEGKYSMDCQLIFADGGNGIQPEDAQTKLTMDYFKEKKLLQIHK